MEEGRVGGLHLNVGSESNYELRDLVPKLRLKDRGSVSLFG